MRTILSQLIQSCLSTTSGYSNMEGSSITAGLIKTVCGVLLRGRKAACSPVPASDSECEVLEENQTIRKRNQFIRNEKYLLPYHHPMHACRSRASRTAMLSIQASSIKQNQPHYHHSTPPEHHFSQVTVQEKKKPISQKITHLLPSLLLRPDPHTPLSPLPLPLKQLS